MEQTNLQPGLKSRKMTVLAKLRLGLARGVSYPVYSIVLIEALLVTTLSNQLFARLAMNYANICIVREGKSCSSVLDPFKQHNGAEMPWTAFSVVEPSFAVKILQDFLEQHPRHSIARLRLGEVLWLLDERQQAIDNWKHIPNADRYFANRVAYEVEAGNLAVVNQLADLADTIFPGVRSAKYEMYRAMCQTSRRQQKRVDAIYWCQRAVWISKEKDVWDLIYLAQAYEESRNLESALEILQRASRLEYVNGKTSVYSTMGHIQLLMGKRDEGIESLQTSLQWDENNRWAHWWLADGYLLADDYQGFCAHRRRAVELGIQPPVEDWAFSKFCAD